MNNILKAFFLTGVTLVLASCELEEQVFSSIYTDNFYKTASDAEAAVAAAYDPIGDMYGGPAALLSSDMSADQTYPRVAVSRNSLTLFSYDANYTAQRTAGRSNESPQQIWASCYDGIEKCNWVIEKVPGALMDATRKKEIIGEAFFLRAFYHWTATKNFGDVVVKIKASDVEANAYVGKAAREDVYKQIYSDLDSAVAKLPEHSANLVKGRPSKQAALALYAKAALYREDWATALTKAEAVMTNGYLTLMDSVRDIYDVAKEDLARVENIFAFESESITSVSGSTSSRSHQMTGLCGPPGNAAPAYGKTTYGSFFAYQAFFNSFAPKDRRRGMLDTAYAKSNGSIVRQKDITPITKDAVLVKKYQDAVSSGNSTNNIPILRLADVYLIAAEAEARSQQGATAKAYDYINAIRQRARIDDLPLGLNLTDFIAAVLQERSWEFFAEGDRWYDLTRTNTFLEVIPLAVNSYYPQRKPEAKHRYFPIPQDEINANTLLVQNDPWK
jgi:hypothetical protein